MSNPEISAVFAPPIRQAHRVTSQIAVPVAISEIRDVENGWDGPISRTTNPFNQPAAGG